MRTLQHFEPSKQVENRNFTSCILKGDLDMKAMVTHNTMMYRPQTAVTR